MNLETLQMFQTIFGKDRVAVVDETTFKQFAILAIDIVNNYKQELYGVFDSEEEAENALVILKNLKSELEFKILEIKQI